MKTKINFRQTRKIQRVYNEWERREEVVWLNYEPGVVHDWRFLGQTFREREAIKRKRARWSARFVREPVAVQQALLMELLSAFRGRLDWRVET